ncbi:MULTISPECIES: HAD family hydrolase [Streptomyces]|uniref:HAD family phosphatase n=1 Tax=Streptomyces indiaensis TaxID=284033 RepID=A0ABN3D4X9_9ACTN|nr:HAD family phosphatase [Streptomyces indiaensis]MCF1648360.1 HAD family phosphatase [Streptomyces indiaensis]
MSALPPAPQAVVFDCDGLLVDTEVCWTRAETKIFAAHGHDFGPEQKALVIGRTLQGAGEAMAEYFGRPGAGRELAAELLGLVREELAQGADALPGAAELVKRCAAALPVAVASNSPRELLDTALTSSGLADYFPVSFAADEVTTAKPAPDLYLVACEALGAVPGRSVAFEDSATGIASARAAGLYVVTVPSLPGAALDHDWLASSLADAELVRWAEGLGDGVRP